MVVHGRGRWWCLHCNDVDMVYSSNHYDEDFYSGEVTIAMWICLKSALNSESGDVSVVVMVMRW